MYWQYPPHAYYSQYHYGYPPQVQPTQGVPYSPWKHLSTPLPDELIYETDVTKALELLMEGIQGEQQDEMFYDYLLTKAPDEEDRTIITGIRDDERRHRKMFRQIYYGLTMQQPVQKETETPFQAPRSYLDGLSQAIMGESDAVRKYRKLYFTVPGVVYKNMVFSILTDELIHGSRYNYLYAKNK
ncbi:ferritin-like domain-containing protein [Mechercharimyces sp. CAU 1602]|uniref:ferritin-like domain-containing protein n=1 Tax=Mechercharimyces sp. CAU 1602 TaxID=2973933 RepID=UPI002161C0EA|nr:ferritin-like domain-containing protein [Mechercharimyces sp. CAU 1602]MCS1350041.1 ferritin-like domain-containing protein [Mechercharimyces sp. CAU 1602]